MVQSFLGGNAWQQQGGGQIQESVDHELLMGKLEGSQGLPSYPNWAVNLQHVKETLEYYFSDESLCSDSYLKSFMMPEEGWVSLMLVQSFPRMRVLGADLFALRQAAMASRMLEIDGAGLFVRIEDQHRRRRWTPRPYV